MGESEIGRETDKEVKVLRQRHTQKAEPDAGTHTETRQTKEGAQRGEDESETISDTYRDQTD